MFTQMTSMAVKKKMINPARGGAGALAAVAASFTRRGGERELAVQPHPSNLVVELALNGIDFA